MNMFEYKMRLGLLNRWKWWSRRYRVYYRCKRFAKNFYAFVTSMNLLKKREKAPNGQVVYILDEKRAVSVLVPHVIDLI